ncbi:ABC transporter permease [Ureaplasma parvum]|uniref:Ribose/galactose ABC transporter n=3 Tax=Ureaplasma parvum TaxID=134821 RepID=Q9PRD2_UREPA|nr:ABC transporter permease [Ureaplasma parvum]pir/A82944/ ribose/galactose ABC transporter UU013 [imported] - Ureaplasma urealyticum [Ureaplasma urealyticum]AAF30418.1 ribose/galactose ABC transporter [Ureaplasma parvum serovar 3 str. ATCC 700970]ACA32858.1 ribose/galactose ABC transporter [Ureaplasma parvum serovar 3 str. ATCC 27815]ASD24625.1 ABC transporter permease [Ureaplasma parvum]ASD25104.1 ABC transporter permease [Ureaplasma parvum]ASD28960.1 ABC transporter permease [Ureaplasma pa
MPSLSLINDASIYAAILILGALSGFFCERVGIANISINGQMIIGALVFTLFSTIIYKYMGTKTETEYTFIVCLIIAGILTIPTSLLFGFLTIKLKTNQIIAGTAINLLASGVATFVTYPLGDKIADKTSLSSDYLGLMKIGDGINTIYIGSILILIAVVLITIGLMIMMKKTPFGLRLYAIGENPNAADAQGINVYKYQWIAVSISGFIAGIGGGLYMYASRSPFAGEVGGIGFLALAILIAGAWRIPLIAVVSIAFAVITKTFSQIDKIPQEIGKLIPYVITLIALISFSKYSVAPKNVGIPFDKTKR